MKYFFLFFACFFLYYSLPAQEPIASSDSTIRALAYEYTSNQYFKFLQRQAQLYSGREYLEFEIAIDGHQYLYSKLWESAYIKFEDLLYKNIDARYDLYRDLLIIKHFDESGRMVSIIPDQNLVKGFLIYGEHYIRIDPTDSIINTPQKAGFYHVIYDGKIPVLAKKIKNMNSSSTTTVSKEFVEKDRHFLIKEQELHLITGKGSLWKLFPEHKKDLKKFARKSGIYFAKEKGFFLTRVIKKYEMLTANP